MEEGGAREIGTAYCCEGTEANWYGSEMCYWYACMSLAGMYTTFKS